MLQFTLHFANSVVVNSDQLWQYSLEAHKFKGTLTSSCDLEVGGVLKL